MDLRLTYDRLRHEIDRADFGTIDSEALIRDVKRGLHLQLDLIIELEAQKKEIDEKIKKERLNLKKMAEKWEI